MHKTPISSRFVVPFKACSTKSLSNIVSKISKMICNHVENFYSTCRHNFKKIWILQNAFSITNALNKITAERRAKKNLTFYFVTLYTTTELMPNEVN